MQPFLIRSGRRAGSTHNTTALKAKWRAWPRRPGRRMRRRSVGRRPTTRGRGRGKVGGGVPWKARPRAKQQYPRGPWIPPPPKDLSRLEPPALAPAAPAASGPPPVHGDRESAGVGAGPGARLARGDVEPLARDVGRARHFSVDCELPLGRTKRSSSPKRPGPPGLRAARSHLY